MATIKRVSFIGLMKFPDTISAVFLIFAFILLISPYLAGADFGIFKVPIFKGDLLSLLKIVGPIVFVIMLILFLPLWTKPLEVESLLQLDDFLPLSVEGKDRRRHFLFEVAVRNPSEHPISITRLAVEFDTPPVRKLAATNVSATYKITVSSQDFCFVQDHNGRYPANVAYNKLNYPELDIVVPCAQELDPKSVDRFRIALDISKDFDLKGPMETVAIVLIYNMADWHSQIRSRTCLVKSGGKSLLTDQ